MLYIYILLLLFIYFTDKFTIKEKNDIVILSTVIITVSILWICIGGYFTPSTRHINSALKDAETYQEDIIDNMTSCAHKDKMTVFVDEYNDYQKEIDELKFEKSDRESLNILERIVFFGDFDK